jgi:hypothetical protein
MLLPACDAGEEARKIVMPRVFPVTFAAERVSAWTERGRSRMTPEQSRRYALILAAVLVIAFIVALVFGLRRQGAL